MHENFIRPNVSKVLLTIGQEYGTPSFVYFMEDILARYDQLQAAFGGRFHVSYAIKSNPNRQLIARMKSKVHTLDASSLAEVDRGIAAGYDAREITFSGPGKRLFEIKRAVELGVGEIVCESLWEIEQFEKLAAAFSKKITIFIRINPQKMPRKFGVNMAGKPGQFGIDEEDLDAVLGQRLRWPHLKLGGFHIYSGTNSLNEEAIAENFGIFIELFQRFSHGHHIRPEKLIFGSGFGIPYLPTDQELDLKKLASLINPQIDALKTDPVFEKSLCVLEMGRWLVGLEGYFLTTVIQEKLSRGTEIRICDGGFNNHLAACGMMGAVVRRNWRFAKVNVIGDEPMRKYLLVGPLCTTIDTLASNIELPQLSRGDVLAVGASGAYGLTASPTRFISHPEPREYLVIGNDDNAHIREVTESWANTQEGSSPA